VRSSTPEFGYDAGRPSRGETTTTGCTGTAHLTRDRHGVRRPVRHIHRAADPIPLLDQTLTAPGKAAFLRSQPGRPATRTRRRPDPACPMPRPPLVVESRAAIEPTHQDWASRG
jgi:hypothetical protein